MKIVVAGIGGVGGYFGGLMARSPEDNEVLFYCRGGNLDAISERGLIIEESDGSRETVRPSAVGHDPKMFSGADVVLICTKSYGLEEMLERIEPHIPEGALAIPLLNGIEPSAVTARRLPRAAVLKGCAYIFATLVEPGVVKRSWDKKRIVFGPHTDTPDEVRATAEGFDAFAKRCGIDSLLTDEIDAELWAKFALVSPNAALTSLFGVENRAIAANAATRDMLARMVREVCAVARANGFELPYDMEQRVLDAGDNSPEGATTSMAVDVSRGNPTEIDSLVGFILREGERVGVATPTYRQVYDGLTAKGVS